MSDRNRSYASTVETPQDDLDDILQQYGYVSNTFDHARDPYISKQLNDEIAARREEGEQGAGSWMISKDQPRPAFEPPEEIRRPEVEKSFSARLAEDDQRARGHLGAEFEDRAPDQPKTAEEAQLDEIAKDYDLDFDHDRFHQSNKASHAQAQS